MKYCDTHDDVSAHYLLARVGLATTSGQSALSKELGLLYVQAQVTGQVQHRLDQMLGHCPYPGVDS